MKTLHYDVVVIGGGPGGLAAAIAARERGAERVCIIERAEELGGILQQCIHNGFGLEVLGADLPGPAYAQHFINRVYQAGVQVLLDTMVLEVTPQRSIYATNARVGIMEIEAGAIVFGMGCRERTRGALAIPGTRPAGVYTAGTAQRLVNIEGYMPGRRFVILGSGDIGMIMARRLTLEGAKVERVLEIMPYLSGLKRNYVQCLEDFGIPLQLSHTVCDIKGNRRVEAVVAVAVDEQWQPIPGSKEVIPCDTLLLSVGLIPENELSRRVGVQLDPITGGPIVDEGMGTSLPGFFAAGNVVHVYDLVDWVTMAGEVAGRSAAEYALGLSPAVVRRLRVVAGDNVRYVVPHLFDPESLARGPQRLQLRVREPIEEKVHVILEVEGMAIWRKAERYVRPGEMVTVQLMPDLCAQLRPAATLKVSVRKQK
ncbi:MAG: NAD(P)/FAD-dependent oxidoreductase [Anaerolineae bacterium]